MSIICSGRAVEIVLEETEKEEEENEKKASTKVQNELLQKITEVRESVCFFLDFLLYSLFHFLNKSLLQDVSIQKKIYGRYFLLLIRDLFKIAKHDHSPISKTELEALGIDIGSAPAIPSERQVRHIFIFIQCYFLFMQCFSYFYIFILFIQF